MRPPLALYVLAFVCLSSAGGCSSVRQLTTPHGGPKLLGTSAVSVRDELPADQTSQACITTAEQLASQGHVREAIQLYEKARALDPRAVDYARRLAPLLDVSGDTTRAASEFKTALQATPNDVDLLNDYGCFQDRQGRFAEAEQLLRQALAVNPNYDRAKINLGIVLAHQGRTQEAFDAFSPVVGPAAAHNNIGMLLAKQGRSTEALRAFHHALALNPQLPQARAAVGYLEKPGSAAVATR